MRTPIDDLRDWVRSHPQLDLSPNDRQRINLVAANAGVQFPDKSLNDSMAASHVLVLLKEKYGD